MRHASFLLVLATASSLQFGCDGPGSSSGLPVDGSADASVDGLPVDAGPYDASAGLPSQPDAGRPDAATSDGSVPDAGAPSDGGGGVPGVDSGTWDSGLADSGAPDSGNSDTDAGPVDAGCVPPTFESPEPATPAPAVIVTNTVLKPSFDRYARLHTVTGLATDVVTVEEICSQTTCNDADPRHDTPKAIKDYLKARPGLKYVVLGGGIDIVAAREVHDTYANPLMPSYTFDARFFTDYYYSDFSEWDTDGDGEYAKKGADTPGYRPSVPVSRIPAHTPAEADNYLAKVIHHLTAYESTKVQKALLVSNIATRFQGLDIDAAAYFVTPTRTISQLPTTFSLSKLYATRLVDFAARPYSAANLEQALVDGQNLVVHSGHSGRQKVTVEIDGTEPFTGDHAYALTNTNYPIFLSSGCEAGDYGVVGTAAERFILAPQGGAIGYLGNAPVGLGLAGGMQIIDELLKYVKASDLPLLGDAYFAAHQNLPEADTFKIIFDIPVIDQNSYWWTQKSVAFFGDLLIPVWKQGRPRAPAMNTQAASLCGGRNLTFTFDAPTTGTLRVLADGVLYEVALHNQTSANLSIADGQGPPQGPAAGNFTVGLVTNQTLVGFWEVTP